MESSVTINPQEISDRSFRVKERLVELRKQLGLSFVETAGILKYVRDSRMYLLWGYKKFEEALSDPDISMSKSTAYGLIQVWELWVDRYKKSKEEIADVPYDKLLMVAGMVTDENHDEMFHTAKSLSRSDISHIKLEKKLNDGRTFKPMPKIWRCSHCDGWRWDADPADECHCSVP